MSDASAYWSVVVRRKASQATTHLVDRELRLGRAAECEIRFQDSMASRIHAMLRPAPEGVWLTDNNSTNGTEVGSRRINMPTLLCGGETIRIGETRFEIQSPGSAGSEATVVTTKPSSPAAAPPASSTQVRCPNCQAANPARSVFCQACSRPL